ncbi:MAG TPA: type IX secretion system membrane protein PorP/SprF [Flavobacterium sp.]|jgi:type IX secretion system PorP/SprF family membrane protein
MKKLILFTFSLFVTAIFAQQDPQYTHYMYNMNVVNPAYATSSDPVLNLGALYRTQWVGAEGAPTTFNFFGHLPVSETVQLGLSLISDEIGNGAKKENNFYVDFAYVLKFQGEHKVSLGLKAGFTSFTTNFNGFQFESGDAATDAAFSENVNIFKPNIGAGIYYFTNKYYLGFSVPNFIPSKHIEERDGINAFGSEDMHYFFTGGYVFKLSDAFKLKPAFMSKFVKASTTVDVSANVLYNNKFELGAAYRFGDAVSALVSINVTPGIRIGYAYDYTISNFGQFNSGTHEVFVLFDLYLIGKSRDKSPRFF